MLLKVQNQTHLLKNTESKAVLNNDMDALREFKNRKNFFKALSIRMDNLEKENMQLKLAIDSINKKLG